MTKLRAVAMMLSFAFASVLSAQALYTTGFESPTFTPGDVDGQDGWGHLGNSPTGGMIVATPPGAPAGFPTQSLAIVMQQFANIGVANNLYSPNIDPPAGETGSTRGGIVVPNPQSTFLATLWYRTPSTPLVSTNPNGRFAELDPSSRGLAPGDAPNRYANVRVFNTTNTLAGVPRVEMRWFTGAGLVSANVATLDWGQWYRFEYRILLVDGTAGPEPNDRFTLTIFDAAGNQLGSVCGSTWELGWKSGTFGGGATARAINGFDFWALSGPNNTVAGYLDQLSMSTTSTPPLAVNVSGSPSVCFGGTTTLTANGSGGSGTITSYVWRDASNNIVSTSPTLVAGAGSYTVTVTDTLCMTATSTVNVLTTCKATPVVTWSDPAPIVYGTLLSATQLNAIANVPGTFTYAPPAGTILNAGASQTLSADFTPTDTTNYNSVNGTTVHLTVDKRPTTTTIDDISPATATAGQPVTVSFHLGNVFGTPGGTVTISDGTSSCTTAAAGTACTLTFASAGPHTVIATFSGDANHLGSTSNGVLYNVGSPRPTALVQGSTLVCSGDSAAIRVTLTGNAPWTLTWSDGVVETATSSPHVRIVKPAQTTTYSLVNVQDDTGSGSVAGSATVTVLVVAPPAILDAPVVEIGKPLTLHATPGYSSYQWFLNGTPIAGATSATLSIPSVTRMDAGSYTVAGSRDGCLSAASSAYSLVLFDLPTDDAVIPVVGSTRGAAGSLFRTAVHLVNGSSDRAQGELTFLDTSIPRIAYSLAPGETRFVDDLLPPSFNGLTSVNVRRLAGPLPTVLAHVFNDGGALGNSGMIERVIPVEATLAAGDRAVLVTPLDPVTTRFNIGLRSLSAGLTVRITRRSADGAIVGTRERALPPSTLVHEAASTFLGATIGGNESLTFEIVEGRGVIYGAATDNGTNDPNMQVATKVALAGRSGRFALPVAGAILGAFQSRFATGLQLHNAGDEPFVATLTFHPAGASASPNDAKLDITVPAHATAGIDDVIAAMHATGLGSLDVAVPPASRPVMLARVYSIADAGQTSLMTELIAEEDFLRAGEDGVVAAPHAPRASRFNIGIRTLPSGVRLTATVRDAAGNVLRIVPLTFPPSSFLQSDAESLLGLTLHGDESVVFHVDEGSAAIYGVWTDNVTQDPAMHYAARP